MPYMDLAIIMGTSLVALIVLGIFVLIGMKIAKGSSKDKARHAQDEEVRTIQEIYQGLAGLEKRVESLETLLYDRKKERES